MSNYNFNELDPIKQQQVAMMIKAEIEGRLRPLWNGIIVRLIISLGISGLGALISYASYESAKFAVSSGSSYEASYTIFVGLIICGIVSFIKTLFLIHEVKKEVKWKRDVMWKSMGIYDYKKYY